MVIRKIRKNVKWIRLLLAVSRRSINADLRVVDDSDKQSMGA